MSHSNEPIKWIGVAEGAGENQGVGGASIGRKGGEKKKERRLSGEHAGSKKVVDGLIFLPAEGAISMVL
jgi:hypothetical protein